MTEVSPLASALLVHPMVQRKHTPQCKGIQGSLGSWTLRYGFWILGTRFRIPCQWYSGYSSHSLS